MAVLIRAFSILASLPGALFLPSIMAVMAEQKRDASSREILLYKLDFDGQNPPPPAPSG
ncbi:MAG: hypothetical protein M0C28_33810 [Candidatus Moduliflexus flocculans]|nr:hypothetical protein [Candidatus Moduliflexus flocculans]